MRWSQKLNELIIWLLIILSGAVYAYFLQRSKSIEDLVIALVPGVLFFSGAVIIFSRDQYKIKKAIQHNEFEINRRLTWFDELRHDLLLYLTPFGVLAIPLVLGDVPNVSTVVEAGLVYLVMLYLKYMYWGEL